MTRKSKREIERLLEELAPAPRARATLPKSPRSPAGGGVNSRLYGGHGF